MGNLPDPNASDDVRLLHKLGYAQELSRCLNGFSNFAISLSIICILAGGITSFHVGYGAVGGAAIGLGWPLVCLFSLCVAATMGHIASAFPTAGGLYHWASILGGRGWGWVTAWFNLLGLVTVLAAINVGTVRFAFGAFWPDYKLDVGTQTLVVFAMTVTQAILNHLGIRVTRVLTDFSGYWIVGVSLLLTAAFLFTASSFDFSRLWTFTNFSGYPTTGDPIWPKNDSLMILFALSFLLPAYTVTGFDASAHASEETVDAARNVPKGIVRSVWVSGLFGWIMLMAIVLAIKDPIAAAESGDQVVPLTIRESFSPGMTTALFAGIVIAQYLCGLATVTSASRVAFAFARDGGLPASKWIRFVSPRFRTPSYAIWLVAICSVLFTLYSPVYATITAVCVIFLYISYVLPTAIGFFGYGRWWTEMGPWALGKWFRPLAIISVIGCLGLIVIGMQPPNDKALIVVAITSAVLAVLWFAVAKRTFPGPPQGLLTLQQQEAIRAAEAAVQEGEGS